MNKKIIYLFVSIILLGVIGVGIFKYINKPMDDFAGIKPEQSFTMSQLLEMADTVNLNKLKNKLIAVEGSIKSIAQDSNATTLEIGGSISYSTIVCQIDARHLSDFSNLKEGANISLKGKMTDYTIDTDLGLGNTIQLNYCSINKK